MDGQAAAAPLNSTATGNSAARTEAEMMQIVMIIGGRAGYRAGSMRGLEREVRGTVQSNPVQHSRIME